LASLRLARPRALELAWLAILLVGMLLVTPVQGEESPSRPPEAHAASLLMTLRTGDAERARAAASALSKRCMTDRSSPDSDCHHWIFTYAARFAGRITGREVLQARLRLVRATAEETRAKGRFFRASSTPEIQLLQQHRVYYGSYIATGIVGWNTAGRPRYLADRLDEYAPIEELFAHVFGEHPESGDWESLSRRVLAVLETTRVDDLPRQQAGAPVDPDDPRYWGAIAAWAGSSEREKRERATSIARELQQIAQEYEVWRGAERTVDLLAASLPQRDLLIDIVEYTDWRKGPTRSYLAVGVSRDPDQTRIRHVSLGAADLIDARARTLRRAILQRADMPPEASELFATLLAPFASEMRRAQRVVVSPPDALQQLPFAVLRGRSGALGDGKPVIYGSPRALVDERLLPYRIRGFRDPSKGLILTDPDYDFGVPAEAPQRRAATAQRAADDPWPLRWGRLAFTQREGLEIAVHAGPRAQFLSGVAANEGILLRARGPAFIHVATHGFFLRQPLVSMEDLGRMARAGRDPFADFVLRGDPLLQSGITLTGANQLAAGGSVRRYGADGILVAAEVANLDLEGTDLVVLSACETGLGALGRGSGVAGLRSAILQAGAQNVIMSLWEVPDQQTSHLMTSFYSWYLNGTPAAESLRLAQVSVRARLRRIGMDHPYYWAGFVLESQKLETAARPPN
jgi:hypothetical protein